MNIITISREFASGGRELGKRMADILGYGYYDSEIILKIAENQGMDPNYVENILEHPAAAQIPLTYGRSFSVIHAISTNLLVEQTKVIKEIAALGKNCIIVGRNADVILEEYNPFRIFVYADCDSKIKRCISRAHEGEDISEKYLIKKMKQIDSARKKTKNLVSDIPWGQKEAYDLMVNTSNRDIKTLTSIVASYVTAVLGE